MTVLSTYGMAEAHDRPLAFIAWTSIAGRLAEIAGALGGKALGFYALRVVREAARPSPVRMERAWNRLPSAAASSASCNREQTADLSRPSSCGQRTSRLRTSSPRVSDWPVLRELVPHAGHVGNSPQAIADGVRAETACHGELVEATALALELQRSRCGRPQATRETLTSRSSDTHVALGALV